MERGPEVSVVLPTLREAESLRTLLPRLVAALRPYRAEILVVDDDSRDGTEGVVAGIDPPGTVRLYVRTGTRGLASAVLEGAARTTGPILAVLDADGSHPPELLPALLEPVRRGDAELALASRHVPGGAPGDMSRTRLWISRSAALLARPLTPVKDPMSGFFAIRRSVLARGPLQPLGYKIALEILVKCRPEPVVEVPFRFEERIAGESKLGSLVIGSYLRHVARLYAYRVASWGRASRTR